MQSNFKTITILLYPHTMQTFGHPFGVAVKAPFRDGATPGNGVPGGVCIFNFCPVCRHIVVSKHRVSNRIPGTDRTFNHIPGWGIFTKKQTAHRRPACILHSTVLPTRRPKRTLGGLPIVPNIKPTGGLTYMPRAPRCGLPRLKQLFLGDAVRLDPLHGFAKSA